MGKVLVIDLAICNGCYNCQVACKDEHVGNDWAPIAKPQPDTGQFWNKMYDMVRGPVPKVKMTLSAQHLPALRRRALHRGVHFEGHLQARRRHRDHRSGQVPRQPAVHGGLPVCDVIYFNDSLNIAQKCTFCAHLLDNGWKEPRCVDACPTGAFTFGEEEDLKDLIAKAEPLKPELADQAAGLLPQPAQEVHRRRGVRSGSRRVHRGRHGHGD